MAKLITVEKGYNELFNGIVTIIKQSRIVAATDANKIIGNMYFNIGKMITVKQYEFGCGNL